jgi:hypothetical protein
MSAHKKRTGLFTFLPRRPLLTLRLNRGFEIPNYNEPALALWLSTEQLEGEGLHENGRVNSMMDAARPWRRGWHPPLVPLAAGRPVHARQDFAHSREDECPTFHRHMAGDHPVNLQPYKYMLLIAVSAPFLMPLQTQTFQINVPRTLVKNKHLPYCNVMSYIIVIMCSLIENVVLQVTIPSSALTAWRAFWSSRRKG